MKILIVGTDTKIFDKDSQVRSRSLEFAQMFEKYSVIVASSRKRCNNERSIGINKNLNLFSVYSKNKIVLFLKTLLIAFIEAKNHDIVSGQDAGATGFIALLAAKLWRKKLHIQIHTEFSLNSVSRIVMAKANRIRVVSVKIKHMIEPHVKCPVDVLPVYIDKNKYKNAEPDKNIKKIIPGANFIIMAMSRIEPEKNIGSIINVFDRLSKKHSRCGLLIVGEGKEKDSMVSLVKEIGNNNISFLPWTNEAHRYYKSVDLFITLSSYEGYGMTIVEALVSGCPVVTTRVGIADEFIKSGYNSWVLDKPVEDNAFMVLDRILSDPGYYRDIKDNLKSSSFDNILSYDEYKQRLLITFS